MNKPQYNPGNQKPAREGNFIRELDKNSEYPSVFKNGKWRNHVNHELVSPYQDIPWREDHTKWFDGKTTCPNKPGVYETRWDIYHKPFYNYWNGEAWCLGALNDYKAAGGEPQVPWRIGHNPNQWRGFNSCQEV